MNPKGSGTSKGESLGTSPTHWGRCWGLKQPRTFVLHLKHLNENKMKETLSSASFKIKRTFCLLQVACYWMTVRKAPPTFSTADRTAAPSWPWVTCCKPSQNWRRRKTLSWRFTRTSWTSAGERQAAAPHLCREGPDSDLKTGILLSLVNNRVTAVLFMWKEVWLRRLQSLCACGNVCAPVLVCTCARVCTLVLECVRVLLCGCVSKCSCVSVSTCVCVCMYVSVPADISSSFFVMKV